MARRRSSRPAHGLRGTKPEPDALRRSAGVQRAILAAAARLVRRLGYNRVTIEAVAAEAGAGKQTIYRWWPSKAALFIELLGEAAIRAPRPFRGSAVAELRRAVALLARRSASPVNAQIHAGLVAEAAADAAVATAIEIRLVRSQVDTLKAILTRGRASGEIRRNADPGLAAEQIVAALWFRNVVGRRRLDRRFTDRVIAQTLRGLTGR